MCRLCSREFLIYYRNFISLTSHTKLKNTSPYSINIHADKQIAPPAGHYSHYHALPPAAAVAASAYARPSGLPSAADMVSSILKKERRAQIRRSDSFSPGTLQTPTKHILLTETLTKHCLEDF